MIFAIDPGNEQSAYVLVGDNMQVLNKGKEENKKVEEVLSRAVLIPHLDIVCERINSYGMPVGRSVFDTCKQIGRFEMICERRNYEMQYVDRSEEKMAICHSTHAGDASIRRALIDMYAEHDLKNGKGTKKSPDWFHGFHDDIWQAFAVAHTFKERVKMKNAVV